MNVDLSNKSINELNFDAQNSSPEELLAATRVVRLTASHNYISNIVGLGALFHQLTHLDLSHNKLGCNGAGRMSGESDHRTPWLSTLPRSLRVLNLSHNHLRGFSLEYNLGDRSCSDGNESPDTTVVMGVDGGLSRLRGSSPINVALFFNRRLFPHLSELDLSHNDLQQTLEDSDVIEELWHESVELPMSSVSSDAEKAAWVQCTTSAIVVLQLDGNAKLESLNGVLCGMEGLLFLHAAQCGIADLTAVSSAATACPKLRDIDLRGTPLSETFLQAPREAVATFTEILLFPALLASRGGVRRREQRHEDEEETRHGLKELVKEIVQHHLHEMEASVERQQSSAEGNIRNSGGGGLRLVLYASLLHQVLPQVIEIDNGIEVGRMKRLFTEAARDVLQNFIENGNSIEKTRDPMMSPRHYISPPRTLSPVEEKDMTVWRDPTSQLNVDGVAPSEPPQGRSCLGKRGADVARSQLIQSPTTAAVSGHCHLTSPPLPPSPLKSPTDKRRPLLTPKRETFEDRRPLRSPTERDTAVATPDAAEAADSQYNRHSEFVSRGVVPVVSPRSDKRSSDSSKRDYQRVDSLERRTGVNQTGVRRGSSTNKCGGVETMNGILNGSEKLAGKERYCRAFNPLSPTAAAGPPLAPTRDVSNSSSFDDGRSSVRYLQAVASLTPMLEHRLRTSSPLDSPSTVNDHSRQSNDTNEGQSNSSSHQHCNNNFSSASSSTFTTVNSTREKLLQQAQALEQSLIRSQDRQRGLHNTVTELTTQLKQHRQLIKDQRQEAMRLRQERDRLVDVIKTAKRRLEKRQKDVAYGATALKRRETLEQQKAVMQRLVKEKKRLQEQERRLRESMAVSLESDTPVLDSSSRHLSPENGRNRQPPQMKKTRSDLLRENAVRLRMEAAKKEEPLAYDPRKFRRNEHSAINGTEGTLPCDVTPVSLHTDSGKRYDITGSSSNRESTDEACRGVKPSNGREASFSSGGSSWHPRHGSRGPRLPRSLYQQGCDPYAVEDGETRDDSTGKGDEIRNEWLQNMSLQSLFDAAVSMQRQRLLTKQLTRKKISEARDDEHRETCDTSNPPASATELASRHYRAPTGSTGGPALYRTVIEPFHDISTGNLSRSGGGRISVRSGEGSTIGDAVGKGEVSARGDVDSGANSQNSDDDRGLNGADVLSRLVHPQNTEGCISSVSSRADSSSVAEHLSVDACSIYAEILKQQQQQQRLLLQRSQGPQSTERAFPVEMGATYPTTPTKVEGLLQNQKAGYTNQRADNRVTGHSSDDGGSEEYTVSDFAQRPVFI
ncbi:leucine-rich repeat protein (LRRP), putative [Trypanosoma equiperdum]|uniref:Leucine-rich repeat protein (LRRP), putative n=1 Tax=Trypanosoma equiperdum TaxID=5694 RepID=A0A1G4I3Z8_TRYEQ|nr:leucine-rich repeat protein (LRRP), putative [Trypanosoma equiperdum]